MAQTGFRTGKGIACIAGSSAAWSRMSVWTVYSTGRQNFIWTEWKLIPIESPWWPRHPAASLDKKWQYRYMYKPFPRGSAIMIKSENQILLVTCSAIEEHQDTEKQKDAPLCCPKKPGPTAWFLVSVIQLWCGDLSLPLPYRKSRSHTHSVADQEKSINQKSKWQNIKFSRAVSLNYFPLNFLLHRYNHQSCLRRSSCTNLWCCCLTKYLRSWWGWRSLQWGPLTRCMMVHASISMWAQHSYLWARKQLSSVCFICEARSSNGLANKQAKDLFMAKLLYVYVWSFCSTRHPSYTQLVFYAHSTFKCLPEPRLAKGSPGPEHQLLFLSSWEYWEIWFWGHGR